MTYLYINESYTGIYNKEVKIYMVLILISNNLKYVGFMKASPQNNFERIRETFII